MEEKGMYGIGLDIGVATGYAVCKLDENGEPKEFVKLGVYSFEKSEDAKSKETLNTNRRNCRSMRRRIRRSRLRRKELKDIIKLSGIATDDEITAIANNPNLNPYQLRVDALDRKLEPEEFVRVLVALGQRRGFKSNRIKEKRKEDGELLKAIEANSILMEKKGYRTVGEMYLKDDIYKNHKRNKSADYTNTVTREQILAEIKEVFRCQRDYGNEYAGEAFEEAFTKRLATQRGFDEGPGKGSPAYGNQIEKMVGKCTLIPGEPRAPKNAFSCAYKDLLVEINNIRLFSKDGCSILTEEQRKTIIEMAFNQASLNYKQIRKKLDLDSGIRFQLKYDGSGDVESKTKIKALDSYNKMKKSIKDACGYDAINEMSIAERDEIARILTLYKSDKGIKEALTKANFIPEIIDASPGFELNSGFGRLSIKACQLIIPYLEQGYTYDKACTFANLDFQGVGSLEKEKKLHITENEMEAITSPVARQSISRAFKVVNAIIDMMGYQPAYINVETTREPPKTGPALKKYKDMLSKNKERNEHIGIVMSEEFPHIEQNRMNKEIFRLWEEQDGRCIYSGNVIPADKLYSGEYEVDHIVPYSISFDDKFSNKVLVAKKENQDKRQRLPMQYLTGEKREHFISLAYSLYSKKNPTKLQNLLKKNITEEDIEGFHERNLADTGTSAVFISNYIKNHLAFDERYNSKVNVHTVNGRITATLRRRWKLVKDRTEGDKHHAQDAAVICCTTPKLIHRVENYYAEREKIKEVCEEGKKLQYTHLPKPWPTFNFELDEILRDRTPEELLAGDGVFVARVPKYKVTGAAHKETVMSAKHIDEGYAVKKVPLTKLKLKNGEIENYYRPETDKLLYEALKKQLVEYNGNAEKAFAESFYKPKADGSKGPLVRGVKVKETTNSYVELKRQGGGIALKDRIVRLDIYKTEKGYEAVPIYTGDVVSKEDRITTNKGRKMKEEEFIFSLHKNDVVKLVIEEDEEEKIILGYYVTYNVNTSQIKLLPHDKRTKPYIEKCFLKAKNFEKYTVDVLGNIHRVKHEKRIGK